LYEIGFQMAAMFKGALSNVFRGTGGALVCLKQTSTKINFRF
jgi:hypothetical protein